MNVFNYVLVATLCYSGLHCATSPDYTSTTDVSVTTTDFNNGSEFTTEITSTVDPDNVTSTTSKPELVTTPIAPIENAEKAKKKKRKRKLKESQRETCPCDLERYYCDVNCCCDPDCTTENKNVFQSCIEDANRVTDTTLCTFSEFIYRNNTPYEWERDQSGLFCVVRTNLPHQYVKQKKISLKTMEDVRKHGNLITFWTLRNDTEADTFSGIQPFIHGGDISIIRNSSTELEMLELPAAYVTDHCLVTQRVQFLVTIPQARCFQTNFAESNDFIRPEFYLPTVDAFVASANFTNATHCHRAKTCVNVSGTVCDEFKRNCFAIVNATTSTPQQSCVTNDTHIDCVNLVMGAQYDFYHNASYGLTRVNVTLSLANKTFGLNTAVGFEQWFQVNFFWWNQTYNLTNIKSGNPGYITGKPILVARFVDTTNFVNDRKTNTSFSSHTVTIVRNSSLFIDNFLTFPTSKENHCIHSEQHHSVIKFGYNVISQCKFNIALSVTNTTSNVTASAICADIQRQIFDLWSIREVNISQPNGTNYTHQMAVGNFGNADQNVTDWSKVIYEQRPLAVLNNMQGFFVKYNSTLSCPQLRTGMSVRIYHAREIFKDLDNQERVVNLLYQFLANPYEFPIRDRRVLDATTLRQSAVFVDITTPTTRKFVDPPSFHLKLPYDFYYPFVRLPSAAPRFSFNWPLVVQCYMAIIVNYVYMSIN